MEIDLEKVVGEVQAYQRKLAEDSAKEMRTTAQARNAEEEAAAMKNLDALTRVKVLSEEIGVAEKIITAEKRSGGNVSVLENQLAERRKALVEAEIEVERDAIKAIDERGDAANRIEEEYLAKKRSELPLEQQIAILQKERYTQNVSLLGMHKDSVGYKAAYVEQSKMDVEIQKLITEQLERQTQADKANLEVAKQKLETVINIRRTGSDYTSQSTSGLTGVAANLNAQLDAPGVFGTVRDAQNTPFRTDPNSAIKNMLEGELAAVMKELNLRSQVVDYDKRYGDQATVQKFGDAVSSRALQGFVTEQQRTNTVLTAISQQLGNAGFTGAAR